jgi:PadR family transcriptional regulator, regulatory protein PadR
MYSKRTVWDVTSPRPAFSMAGLAAARRHSTPHCCRIPTAMPDRLEFLQGTLDMLVLRTLLWGPNHGHGIAQTIRANSNELLQVETGSLYPALHRLEKKGWLSSEWKTSENNQRAKYYRLTPAGKKQLLSEQSKWDLFVQAVAGIMRPAD